MEIFLAILLPFMLVGGSVLIGIAVDESPDKKKWLAVTGAVIVWASALLFMLGQDKYTPKEICLHKWSVKTEVRLKITNGQETSRDTVYIFTPRKK